MEGAARGSEERPLAEWDEGRRDVEPGVGVEGGVGEDEQDGPREGDGLWMDDEEEGMEGECLLEPVFLSEPNESDSLCLLEDGGGGRRGTLGSGLDSGGVGCVSGCALSDSSSRSRESSCTTTSATSASFVSCATCGASSHTDPGPEGPGDGDTE